MNWPVRMRRSLKFAPLNRPAEQRRSLAQALVGVTIGLLAVSWAGPGQALVLDDTRGEGNTQAPEPDPGWAHVVQHLGGPSAVYLGCRWILTTQHVGVTIMSMEGTRFNPIAESITPIANPDGELSDLVLFQIDKDPGLDPLRIPARPARIGQEVTLIGFGSSRGSSLTSEIPDRGLVDGFYWKADQTKRWATNRVSTKPTFVDVNQSASKTRALPLLFEPLEHPESTRDEASAAFGDSGGAVFGDIDPVFPSRGSALLGLIFSVSRFESQPKSSSLYGNATWVADLSYYRDSIIKAIQGNPLEGESANEVWQPHCPPAPEDKTEIPAPRTFILICGVTLMGSLALIALWRTRA